MRSWQRVEHRHKIGIAGNPAIQFEFAQKFPPLFVFLFDSSFLQGWLAFGSVIDDMGAGRLVVDEPLANRVRSGRKQP
jgi:hypothetical protein